MEGKVSLLNEQAAKVRTGCNESLELLNEHVCLLSRWEYLKCEENVRTFLSSFRLVPHNVSGIPPTLWPTMWQECEENVSLNEDAYCVGWAKLSFTSVVILTWVCNQHLNFKKFCFIVAIRRWTGTSSIYNCFSYICPHICRFTCME